MAKRNMEGRRKTGTRDARGLWLSGTRTRVKNIARWGGSRNPFRFSGGRGRPATLCAASPYAPFLSINARQRRRSNSSADPNGAGVNKR
jgi:hypothetical protein